MAKERDYYGDHARKIREFGGDITHPDVKAEYFRCFDAWVRGEQSRNLTPDTLMRIALVKLRADADAPRFALNGGAGLAPGQQAKKEETAATPAAAAASAAQAGAK